MALTMSSFSLSRLFAICMTDDKVYRRLWAILYQQLERKQEKQTQDVLLSV
jgi:hypothetical protein